MSGKGLKWAVVGGAGVSWSVLLAVGVWEVAAGHIDGQDWLMTVAAVVAGTLTVTLLVSAIVLAALPEPLAAFLMGRLHPYSTADDVPHLSLVRNDDTR